MQLSSKASSVVLKSFPNARSPHWHSSFQHLTHTRSKLPQAPTLSQLQHEVLCLFSQSALRSWSTTAQLARTHPLSVTPPAAAALPSTFLLQQRGREPVLLCSSSSLPVSFFLLGKTSGRRHPLHGLSSPGRGLGEEGSQPEGKSSHARGVQE